MHLKRLTLEETLQTWQGVRHINRITAEQARVKIAGYNLSWWSV